MPEFAPEARRETPATHPHRGDRFDIRIQGEGSPFDGVFSRGGAAAAVSGEAWLQAMLDAERALARAQGLDLSDEAFSAGRYDLAEIGWRAAEGGNPVIPLVEGEGGARGARRGDEPGHP